MVLAGMFKYKMNEKNRRIILLKCLLLFAEISLLEQQIMKSEQDYYSLLLERVEFL